MTDQPKPDTSVPRRTHDVTAAGVTGASVAVFAAAVLAVLAGSLRPWLSAVSVALGLGVTMFAVRSGRERDAAGPGARLGVVEVLALAAFAALSLRQFGWLVFERDGSLLTLLPYNYGDLPLHWTYIRHVAGGASFWPETPILTATRLRYPLGVDLLSAVLLQLGGSLTVLLPLMGLAGAAWTAVALNRWGGPFAVAGFLFSGGLAGLQALWTGQVFDYQSSVAWKSLYLALFVPQRGYLLALPAGLLLLWSWRERLLRGEPGLATWVEGLLWGILPLVHLHTFAFVSLIGLVWTLGGGRWRAALPTLAVAFVPASFGVLEVTDGLRAASLVGWRPGWMIGGEGALVFLLLNFGLYLPLALAALVVAARRRDREALLVLGPALAVFVLLFFVKVAPWEWDNTKVMLWCYLTSLPAIGTLVIARLHPGPRALALFVLFFSGAISVVGASLGRGPRLEVLEKAEYDGVCRALAPLGRDERVATAQAHNHPVALCGQPVVAGYGGHIWSHGLDGTLVQARLGRLLAGQGDYRAEARALHARYVFWGSREQAAFPASARPWASGPPLASGPWGALYRLEW